MAKLEARRIDLFNEKQRTPDPIPRLHPNLAEIYRKKVSNLAEALNEEDTRTDASQAIRGLIEEVRLVPEENNLKIELFGELAALINLSGKCPGSKEPGPQVTLVAGARSHLYRTQFIWPHPSRKEWLP